MKLIYKNKEKEIDDITLENLKEQCWIISIYENLPYIDKEFILISSNEKELLELYRIFGTEGFPTIFLEPIKVFHPGIGILILKPLS